MRIVMISDTHEMHGNVRVPDGDVLIHAGDFTGKGDVKAILSFAKWLGKLPHKRKIVIPGNHDLLFEKDWSHAKALMGSSGAHLLNRSGMELTHRDNYIGHIPPPLTIWGEPRTPEFCDWAFNVPHDQMYRVWAEVPSHIDILISHGPPHGVCDTAHDGRRVGCQALRGYIEKRQPRLVICGHIHGGHGLGQIGRTMIVNASICTEEYKPTNKPIVLDLW